MARSPGVTVFTNRSRRPYRSGFGATFRGVITRAGLTDFHFHDMRHHAATTMRRHGVQLDVIAQQLGHSSLQMSARYAHIDNATQRAAASQLTPLPKADATRKPPAARHRLRALP
jgi:integrase